MACPICGANCKCRNRGSGGICCKCHKHKPRKIFSEVLNAQAKDLTEEMKKALELHIRRNEEQLSLPL
jgi:hypothetical protein